MELRYRKVRFPQVTTAEYRFAVAFPLPEWKGDFVQTGTNRMIIVAAGYGWDGASGPTIDTRECTKPALEHDVLYELLRKAVLPKEMRSDADKHFRDRLLQEGMAWPRAQYWYFGVRRFGGLWNTRTPATDNEVVCL